VFAAEVEYRDITSDGLLRASWFKGLSKASTHPCKGVGWVCKKPPGVDEPDVSTAA
jgi:hypothetical protein